MTNTNFADTAPTFAADLAEVSTPYRYLNWVAAIQHKAYSVGLEEFSPERQAAIAALVDHGLISERRWTGGEEDGRVTYRVTEVGQAALEEAWSVADAVIVNLPNSR